MDKAVYKNIPVDILHIYEAGGVKRATVRAVEGKPFTKWGKWLTKTSYATTTLDQLSGFTPDPQPEPAIPNLLSLALEYRDKQQWSAGEAVWLWRSNRPVLMQASCRISLNTRTCSAFFS